VVLDELPRLPNGKTNRRALPPPELVVAPGTAGSTSSGDVRSHLRSELRRLWEELLPVGTVGDDEDFAHLGGDSLLAAQMLVQFEHRTGIVVPMGEMVHARTVRDLAEVAARIRTAAGSPVTMCVQHGDESVRPRLWFVHDLQGSGYRVRHLAAELGPDQPVWSFESPLLGGEPNPFSSLETFAALYATELRRTQPSGPYWLAGYSFGGICAYEIARQLERDGDEVAFLGVVDVGPGYRGPGWHGHHAPFRPWFGVRKPPSSELSTWQQLRAYARMVRETPAGFARHLMVRSGLAQWIDPVRFRLEIMRTGRVRPEWRLWYAWDQHWRLAARAWDRATPYPGRLDLFWANESPSADATMGWSGRVGEVAVHRFDGDHEGVLEPRGAPAMARVLRAAIDERAGRL
jgi:thioesterase domain-containing protein/acyl carrier protein